jgi:hypothetical protein
MKIYDGNEPRKLVSEARKALAAGLEAVINT